MSRHRYLSTGCFHGHHDYCQSMTGCQGEKRPGRCKFCDARCACECHDTRADDMLALLSCDCDPEQGRHTCGVDMLHAIEHDS